MAFEQPAPSDVVTAFIPSAENAFSLHRSGAGTPCDKARYSQAKEAIAYSAQTLPI